MSNISRERENENGWWSNGRNLALIWGFET